MSGTLTQDFERLALMGHYSGTGATTVFFILSGAYDVRYTSGAGFFPETLRSEYHGIRATIEAYARTAVIAGKDEATACGIGLSKGSGEWNHLFRVTSKGAAVTYRLDRWD